MIVSRWFVTQPGSKKEVPETRGDSKEDSQQKLILRQAMLRGEEKPWVFWEKRGYRVRRGD